MEQSFTPEELKKEEWRDIPYYIGYYRASSLGRILSLYGSGARLLKAHPAGRGRYLQVRLCRDGVQRHWYIHQLVALAFIGPCPEGKEVNHKDTNKTNNRTGNLEYLTKPENREHARLNGCIPSGDNHWSRRTPEKTPRGERHFYAKLTEDKVRYIRTSKAFGYVIAKELGMSFSMICRIRRGEGWKHVK